MKKVIPFLENKYFSLLCLLLAIACRVINVCFVSFAGRDKMILVLQSKGLLEGKGLGIPQYFVSNIDAPVFDYTPMWPPGYPLLLAPLLKIFNYNIYAATTTLDILFCLALIFVVRKLCALIGMPKAGINIMTLVAGCFEYPFINESLPTDTIGLVFFLVALSLVIRFISVSRFSSGSLFINAFLLFIPCLFRYSYPPVSLAVPLSILLTGLLKKDRLIQQKGTWLFLVTLLITIFFFGVLKIITGYAGYATPTTRGFFPENIVHWFPFAPSAFINIAFLTSQAIHLTGLSFNLIMQWLEVINVILVIVLISVFLYQLSSKKLYASLSSFNWFAITGFFASMALLVLLAYFSFTYEVQKGFINDWNYVTESRYFGFIVLFLQVLFVGWLLQYRIRNSIIKITAWLCVLFLTIEVTHNIYFYTKVAAHFRYYKNAVYREQDYTYFNTLLSDLKKDHKESAILVAAPGDNFYQYAATYYSNKGIADAATLKEKLPVVKKKSLLLLMLYDNEVSDYEGMLRSANALLLKKIHYSNFYLIELNP